MSGAPILRSAALQRAMAQTSKPQAPGAQAAATFADTLAQTQSQTQFQSLNKGTRASAAAAWSAASQPARSAAAQSTRGATLRTVSATAAAPIGNGAVPFADLITAAATRHGVDPALLAGLVKQESNFNPNARSGVGAKGLTQLMDATARGLGVTDSLDPAQSLEGGAKFLGGLLKQFKGDEKLALAAYNAGPGAVQKYGGIPPYEETQRYVPKVLGYASQYRRIWADSSATPTTPLQTN